MIFYEIDRTYYLTHPWLIWWPFRDGEFVGLQGLSYHGGILGVVCGMWLFCRRYRQAFLVWAERPDCESATGLYLWPPGQLLQQASSTAASPQSPGAWCSPRQSDSPTPCLPGWTGFRTWPQKSACQSRGATINLPRHPSQFYEALGEGVLLWLFLWFVVRPRRPYPGFISGCYLIGYGLIRFFLEYLRQPDVYPGYVIQLGGSPDVRYFSSFGNISMGQILSFIMIIAGLLVIALARSLHGYRQLKARLDAPRHEQSRAPRPARK